MPAEPSTGADQGQDEDEARDEDAGDEDAARA